MEDIFTIANKNFNSRLIVGTGKYKNFEETANAVKASGADIVTVAVRRVNILDKDQPLLMDYLDPKSITYLPNTAGCYSSEEALRTLRLAREMGGWRLVKLEVLGDKKTLYPNMIETIKSTEVLVKEGFEVMVYCTDDPIMTKKLEDVGASAIMPLGAPIGSGIGIQNKINIAEYVALFPNVMLGIHKDHYYAYWLEPVNHELTIEHMEIYYAGNEAANSKKFKSLRKQNLKLWYGVQSEDVGIIEGMQEGRNSPA